MINYKKNNFYLIKFISKTKMIFKCDICGIEKEITFSDLKANSQKHGKGCTELLFKKLKEKYNEKILKKFLRTYNNSRTRATNKNYKKNKKTYLNVDFEYNNFYEFYKKNFSKFLKALETISLDEISIDRINNNIGYFTNNIQFIKLSEQSGKRLIHDNRNFDFLFKNKIYKNIKNLEKFSREIKLDKSLVYQVALLNYNDKKYGLKLIKMNVETN